MAVRMIVPWRGGCPHRERALSFVSGRSPWPATIAEAPPGPWCKAAAVMPAVENCSDDDVLVIHDADVWTDGLAGAVAEVEAGSAWAIPHRGVFRLTEGSTARAIGGEPWEGLPLDQPAYLGVEGGGIIVAPKAVILSIPPDSRFVGWG